jgi:HNH endonuclease
MQLQSKCFKIDKSNAKAMVHGFLKNDNLHRQAIWLVRRNSFWPSKKEKLSPALITLHITPPRFKNSPIGQAMNPEKFAMPLKYIADLVCEYFIRNDKTLWKTICSNDLFDIWEPEEPYRFFSESDGKPTSFRLQLLRVYEIDREFQSNDIEGAKSRFPRLRPPIREVAIKRPIISDVEFRALKNLLERSVKPYLTRPASCASTALSMIDTIDITVRDDIESFEHEENQTFVEGERVSRYSNFYERNRELRAAAVRHHGTVCKTCGFDFSEIYGEHGREFIEVHHLIPVSSLTNSKCIDPVYEMTVLCSNCHRMIHRRRNNILTIDQLKEIIRRKKDS